MSRVNQCRRSARFEWLEQRQLLAGDVLVNVVRGDLVIRGDAEGNEIAVTAGDEPGTYVVTGLNGTTVHQEGQTPASEVRVTGVRNDVRINLGEGDDSVSLTDAAVRGSVSINTGAGADEVTVDQVSARGGLAIDTADDNDTVTLGSADDTGPTPLGGRDGALEGALRIRKGIRVNLGAGNDSLTVENAASLIGIGINGGLGDDTISANGTSGSVLAILGDGGTDTISLNDVRARHAGVHAGAGNDDVTIEDSFFTTLGVALGEGDDTLSIGGNQARFAVLLGGAGEDTLEELAENDFGFQIVRGFENPDDANSSTVPLSPRLLELLDRLDDVSEAALRDLLARILGDWGLPRRR
ncbi:MAG TPA: hypothetical protein VHK01_09970 [Lacipirellulaceae bacterium]|jgi:hypothetical protein|nr:hypothetical protein [Lacipirellulaceae bacterium]